MHDKYHPHTTSFPLKVFLLVQYYNYSSTVVGPRTSNIRTGGADNNPWNIPRANPHTLRDGINTVLVE